MAAPSPDVIQQGAAGAVNVGYWLSQVILPGVATAVLPYLLILKGQLTRFFDDVSAIRIHLDEYAAQEKKP